MTLAETGKATYNPFNHAKLAKYYGPAMDFMRLTKNKNHPNTSLYELHLNDSMIDLSKSGVMNTQFLREFVCHPQFLRLLTDI